MQPACFNTFFEEKAQLNIVVFRDLLRRHSQIHGSVVPDSRKDPACDACHSSKVKCDGGAQCTLCKKRNAECTYDRASISKRRHVDRSPDLQTRPAAAANDMESQYTSPTPESTSCVLSAPNSPEIHSQPGILPWDKWAEPGAKALAHALSAIRLEKESKLLTDAPEWLKTWLDECSVAYIGQFHERWPIIHSPSRHTEGDPALVPIITTIIGAWHYRNRHHKNSSDSSKTIAIFRWIHKSLMRYLISQMVR